MAYYVDTMAFCGTSGFILLLWFIEMEAAFHVSVAIINRFVEPSSSCHYYVHSMAFCGTSGFILLLWFIEMEAAFHVSLAIINRFVEPSSSCHTSYWNHQPKLNISRTAVQFIFKAKAIGTAKTFVSLQLFLSPSAFQFHLTHPYTTTHHVLKSSTTAK
jgi:hypothetical protein